MDVTNVKLLQYAIVTLILVSCMKRESYDDRTAREMQEYSQTQCPRRIDPYTILDSIVYNADSKELSHYYSVQDTLDNENVYTEDVCREFRNKLLSNIRNSIGMKTYKEHGVTFTYIYRSDKFNRIYLDIKFTKADYQ